MNHVTVFGSGQLQPTICLALSQSLYPFHASRPPFETVDDLT
jgi:hypothetical protein